MERAIRSLETVLTQGMSGKEKPLITNFLTLGAIPNLLDGQQTAVPSL